MVKFFAVLAVAVQHSRSVCSPEAFFKIERHDKTVCAISSSRRRAGS
jgi:hypothetical protein